MPITNRESWNNLDDYNINQTSRSLSSSPRFITPNSSKQNSPTPPSSPLSTSPPNSFSTLRRTYSKTFTLIPEDREIEVKNKNNIKKLSQLPIYKLILKLIFWWLIFIFNIIQKLFNRFINYTWLNLFVSVPTFWVSAWLWIFWQIVRPPLYFFKWILIFFITPANERNRKKRTILISCGSTIQALHMARNFYMAGARVIVFEIEGYFGIARFSTAVSKFYTVAKPTPYTEQDYVSALCDIVEKEKVMYYIPICATNVAHYDALAKPHLELLGCTTFIPGTQEVAILDDLLKVMKKCRFYGIPLPPHRVLTSKEDLYRLYEIGWMSGLGNIMISGSSCELLDRYKILLPHFQCDIRLNYEISEQKPWVVIHDLPGVHYITCTTVKDSCVIANVTCSVKPKTKSLVPVENEDIEKWIMNFFSKIRLHRPITGHFSFRLIKCEQTNEIFPIGTKVGVSLPYICHTGVHSRVLYKPCAHFSRQNSGPLVQDTERYWMHELIINTLKNPSLNTVGKLIGTVLDKREAIFVYWDPLPYLAYYHFQLPFKTILSFLKKIQTTRKITNGVAAPTN